MEQCIICHKAIDDGHLVSKLTEKGCVSINSDSATRKDSLHINAGQYVHTDCRRDLPSDSATDYSIHDMPATTSRESIIEDVTLLVINEAFDVMGQTPLDPKRLKLQGYGIEVGAFDAFNRNFKSKIGWLVQQRNCRVRTSAKAMAGAAGTHNVCVCKLHQNFKLMLDAMDLGDNYFTQYGNLMAFTTPGSPTVLRRFSQILEYVFMTLAYCEIVMLLEC
ncbi:hypothetical protein KUTeg_007616 [Tegillarca granosa]|uniref:Uncharacterized protein n=1 Tax=Tegillarca granosa TaxID=220873 RepID=A0ABQ9FFR1_TEGGR|nr:hypothetical protein KUTeg_007616 [Tegillarca granosa]